MDKNFYKNRKKRMIEMRDIGVSIGDIGRIYNISRQRVHQITKDYGKYKPKWMTELRNQSVCYICKRKNDIVLHHINKDSQDHRATNIMPLCHDCHTDLHFRDNRPKRKVLHCG